MKKIGTFQYSTRGDARVNAGIPTVAESTTSWDTSQETELGTILHPIKYSTIAQARVNAGIPTMAECTKENVR